MQKIYPTGVGCFSKPYPNIGIDGVTIGSMTLRPNYYKNVLRPVYTGDICGDLSSDFCGDFCGETN